ncbi:hypothetical protein FQR65_LT11323 [Abscondita terminalis]|nr:hypothetical protein FQR65_LT11323 [Abscondita terminalis]
MLVSGVLAGICMDRFGRIATIKLSAIPNILGWILMGTASSADCVIVGRFITGFASSFIVNTVYVYVGEVSQPNIRGALLSSPSLYLSIGLFSMYIQGRFLHWRLICWIVVASTLVIASLLFLLPESPSWLISKKRIQQAAKSLEWFFDMKNKKDPKVGSVEIKVRELAIENLQKNRKQEKISWRTFGHPTIYKPFLILAGLFSLQQFSGCYVIISNSIIFLMEIGVTYDLYLVTIVVSVIRMVMSIVSLWLLKVFNRRTLLLASSLGMATSLALSALGTNLMPKNESIMWLPVASLIMYFIFAGCGVYGIPFVLSAELYPLNVRGLMQSCTMIACNLMLFAALHSYDASIKMLGASRIFSTFTRLFHWRSQSIRLFSFRKLTTRS